MAVMIERLVMDPTIPIERLEQVLALKERMEDRAREDDKRRAKKEYFAAMSRCQAELPVVTRNRQNTHTDSTYADLADIEMQAMPIIHRHGFGVSFQPNGYNEKGELRILWEITHDGGHSRSDTADIPIDNVGAKGTVNKTGTQAFGSTATYGRRYLLCMLFNISTGDDRDGNQVKQTKFITEEQVQQLQNKIVEVGADPVKSLKVFKIEAFTEMKASEFPKAMQALADYGQRNNANV
jgi:hypothetical protein